MGMEYYRVAWAASNCQAGPGDLFRPHRAASSCQAKPGDFSCPGQVTAGAAQATAWLGKALGPFDSMLWGLGAWIWRDTVESHRWE